MGGKSVQEEPGESGRGSILGRCWGSITWPAKSMDQIYACSKPEARIRGEHELASQTFPSFWVHEVDVSMIFMLLQESDIKEDIVSRAMTLASLAKRKDTCSLVLPLVKREYKSTMTLSMCVFGPAKLPSTVWSLCVVSISAFLWAWCICCATPSGLPIVLYCIMPVIQIKHACECDKGRIVAP